MADLSTQEKAEKLDKIETKRKMDAKERKLKLRVWGLRGTQLGVSLFTSASAAMVNKAYPAAQTALYGLVQPDVVTTVLGVGGVVVTDDEKSPFAREIAMGMLTSGSNALARMGGEKLYDLIAG